MRKYVFLTAFKEGLHIIGIVGIIVWLDYIYLADASIQSVLQYVRFNHSDTIQKLQASCKYVKYAEPLQVLRLETRRTQMQEFSVCDRRCPEFLLSWCWWGAPSTIVEPGGDFVER